MSLLDKLSMRAVEVESHFLDQIGFLIEHCLKSFHKCPRVARASEGAEMSETAKISFPVNSLRLAGRVRARIDNVGFGGVGCGSADRRFPCAFGQEDDRGGVRENEPLQP